MVLPRANVTPLTTCCQRGLQAQAPKTQRLSRAGALENPESDESNYAIGASVRRLIGRPRPTALSDSSFDGPSMPTPRGSIVGIDLRFKHPVQKNKARTDLRGGAEGGCCGKIATSGVCPYARKDTSNYGDQSQHHRRKCLLLITCIFSGASSTV